MNILVTGGTGYIGSHAVVELLNHGHSVIIIDNLSNSKRNVLDRIRKITHKEVVFCKADLRSRSILTSIFQKHPIDAVLHFAGLKSVGESVAEPLRYYTNNVDSTLSLLEVMERFNVKNLIFSSSATVYGDPISLPITEDMPLNPTNPYGHTKMVVENLLESMCSSHSGWNITSLRYFNPVGAHTSGLIGESPKGTPNNLLPYISQVAAGKLEKLTVFGNDYETDDGTGVRDYIHVTDLAEAHLAALQNLDHPNTYKVYNVGTGTGVSVLQLIAAFEISSAKKIPYEISNRRAGDIALCYADPTLAYKELKWKAKLSIQEACHSSWKWQSLNPDGY